MSKAEEAMCTGGLQKEKDVVQICQYDCKVEQEWKQRGWRSRQERGHGQPNTLHADNLS